MCDGAQRPLHARRRHFQYIPTVDEVGHGVETSLNGPRRPLAITNLYFLAIQSIDADVQHWATFRPPDTKLRQLVFERRNFLCDNCFQLVLHVDSRQRPKTKKCGETFPHITPTVPCAVQLLDYRWKTADSQDRMTATCRWASPHRWEKNWVLSHRVQWGLAERCCTPASRPCSASRARRSTFRFRVVVQPVSC